MEMEKNKHLLTEIETLRSATNAIQSIQCHEVTVYYFN